MSGKTYPISIVELVRKIVDAWRKIKADLTLGDLTIDMLADDLTQAEPVEARIADLENQLTEARNQRDELYERMWERTKRVRSAIKGIYGDDSPEYELVGGTAEQFTAHVKKEIAKWADVVKRTGAKVD